MFFIVIFSVEGMFCSTTIYDSCFQYDGIMVSGHCFGGPGCGVSRPGGGYSDPSNGDCLHVCICFTAFQFS